MEMSGELQRPGRFTIEETTSSTQWIGGWVGFRIGLDTMAKRKNPCRESNLSRPNHILVTMLRYPRSYLECFFFHFDWENCTNISLLFFEKCIIVLNKKLWNCAL
jgi:hypothetical protein